MQNQLQVFENEEFGEYGGTDLTLGADRFDTHGGSI